MGEAKAKANRATERAGDAAEQTGASTTVQMLARLGMCTSGVVHLLIGWIAVQLAWSGSSDNADPSGALQQLAQTPLGPPLLWIAVVGLTALSLWHLTEIFTSDGAKDKVKAAGKVVVHVALAWSAGSIAVGAGSDGEEASRSATATLMEQPAGVVLVIAVGLVAAGIGVSMIINGVKLTFLEELTAAPGRWLVVCGRVGYIAKGAALVIVGALFGVAAATDDPEEAGGVDGALRALLELPFGPYLLTAIALGLAAYGVFMFGKARHARF